MGFIMLILFSSAEVASTLRFTTAAMLNSQIFNPGRDEEQDDVGNSGYAYKYSLSLPQPARSSLR